MKAIFIVLSYLTVLCSNSSFAQDSSRVIILNNSIAIKKLAQLTADNTWVEPGDTIVVNSYDSESKFYQISYKGEIRFAYYSMLNLAKQPEVNSQPSFTDGSSGSSRTIHTGPKGGKYYINKNGNKTYVKKK